jgi:hypothetical protein
MAASHMVIRVPELTGYAGIRHVAVSLARVPALVDGVKYIEPRDVPRLEGSELRRARAPSMRYLVRLALKCESAEEFGKRLRRRYQRQQQRMERGRMSASAPIADMAEQRLNVRFGLPAQPVDATQALNLSAGVSNCKV